MPLAVEPVYSLSPVVIEATVPKEQRLRAARPNSKYYLLNSTLSKPDPNRVRPPVGDGAPIEDPDVNRLGLEMRNLEGSQSLAAEWLPRSPWSREPVSRTRWGIRLHVDAGMLQVRPPDQKSTANLFERSGTLLSTGPFAGTDTEIQIGASVLPGLENRTNGIARPPSDAQRFSWLSAWGSEEQAWACSADFHRRNRTVLVSTLPSGNEAALEASVALRGWAGPLNWTPHVQWRDSRFSALPESGLHSNQSAMMNTGIRIGFSPTLIREAASNVTLDAERQTLRRNSERLSLPSANLGLNRLATEFSTRDWKTRHLEADLHIRTEQSALASVWDAGASLSSPHRHAIGVALQARRFAHSPTATQKFGDGASLEAAPTLPAETGVRWAAGPWWESHFGKWKLFYFQERSQGLAVTEQTSPFTQRTTAIGGVKNHGILTEVEWTIGRMQTLHHICSQKARNASNVRWQRGAPIPSRPDWVTRSDVGIKMGFLDQIEIHLQHEFHSEDTIDVGGFLIRPAYHTSHATAAYKTKQWELRLLANHLFRWPRSEPTFYSAGEPLYSDRTFRLQWEIQI